MTTRHYSHATFSLTAIDFDSDSHQWRSEQCAVGSAPDRIDADRVAAWRRAPSRL